MSKIPWLKRSLLLYLIFIYIHAPNKLILFLLARRGEKNRSHCTLTRSLHNAALTTYLWIIFWMFSRREKDYRVHDHEEMNLISFLHDLHLFLV